MQLFQATEVAVSGLLLGAFELLFGQAIPNEIQPIGQWLDKAGGITSLGFAVWYAWYVTTKTIPEMSRRHAENVDNVVKEHREVVDSIIDSYRKESAETRNAYHAELAAWREHLKPANHS